MCVANNMDFFLLLCLRRHNYHHLKSHIFILLVLVDIAYVELMMTVQTNKTNVSRNT